MFMNSLSSLARQGSIDEIRIALNADPKILHEKTQDDDTLLHLACHKANLNLVRELLKMKVDVNLQNRDGMTPLMFVAYTEIYPEFQEKIIEEQYPLGPLAMMMRFRRDELQVTEENIFSIVSLLLENGANPNITTRYKQTAFNGALTNRYMKVCQLLIEKKVDIRIGDPFAFANSKGNRIIYSGQNQDLEVVSKLFYYGSHPDMKWQRCKNFIMFLVACGYRDICGTKTPQGVKFVSTKAQITHEQNVRKNSRDKLNQKLNGKLGTKDERIRKWRREKIFCEEGLIRLIASFL
jgi:Ankyrin repeats (many copies)